MKRQSSWLILAVSFYLLVFGSMPAAAQMTGVRFSVAPGLHYYLWDENMALKNATLYGGRLSADLGRFVSVQGYYLANDRIKTDLAGVSFGEWGTFSGTDQKLRGQNYGADLVFNLGQGRVVPFIQGGGGIFRFDPNQGEIFEQIATKVGFGTRFDLHPNVRAQIHIEDVMLRFDRTRLLPAAGVPETPPVPVDAKRNGIRHNISFGVGLNFRLSGAAEGETDLDRALRHRYASGLFGASWPIEPYAGRLNFDKSAGLDDRSFLGVRTGVNLGDLLGLRAYYWHGMSDRFDDTTPVQSWGGEAQFNLASGQGAIPYLLLGFGHLDFLKDFRDTRDSVRSDRGVLILGGGVGLTLARNIRINLSARDNMFSESDLSDLAQPSELLHNWAFAGGLTFIFGGKSRGRDMGPLGSEQIAPYGVPATPVSLPETYAPTGPMPPTPPAHVGEVRISPPMVPATTPQSFQGERMVSLPVPTVGEIYVRYGEPGGVTIASQAGAVAPGVSEALRQAVREELAAAGLSKSEKVEKPEAAPEAGLGEAVPGVVMSDEQRFDLLEERLENRIADLLDRHLAEQKIGAPTVVIPPTTPSTVTPDVRGAAQPAVGRNVLYPYMGINLDYPEQMVLAARLDLGPVRPGSKIRLLPEVALGFFTKGSVMVSVNTQYNFGSLERKGQISPYVFAGLGVIRFGKGVDRDRTEAVLNLGYGLARNFGKWTAFVEHQGIDFYSLHRLNFGVRYML